MFGLAVLILLFGPVSGAHFNPVVSAADWLLGRRAGTGISVSHVASYTEQSSIPVDQDLLCGLLGSGGVVGPFDEFAVLELRAGADERHEMGRVDRPPA